MAWISIFQAMWNIKLLNRMMVSNPCAVVKRNPSRYNESANQLSTIEQRKMGETRRKFLLFRIQQLFLTIKSVLCCQRFHLRNQWINYFIGTPWPSKWPVHDSAYVSSLLVVRKNGWKQNNTDNATAHVLVFFEMIIWSKIIWGQL